MQTTLLPSARRKRAAKKEALTEQDTTTKGLYDRLTAPHSTTPLLYTTTDLVLKSVSTTISFLQWVPTTTIKMTLELSGNLRFVKRVESTRIERERVLVLNLASILRVADALDRGHSQQIKEITLERRGETVILHTKGMIDLSLEQAGLEEKADLFQDVFGFKVILS